jgi:hypothetical protein
MSTTDQLVREAVDQIFQKMDQNHDSYLEAHEVIALLNMGLRHLGKNGSASFAAPGRGLYYHQVSDLRVLNKSN